MNKSIEDYKLTFQIRRERLKAYLDDDLYGDSMEYIQDLYSSSSIRRLYGSALR